MNLSEPLIQLKGEIVNLLQIIVPVVIASALAFLLGRRVEANRSPKRAEKFILNYLADGKEHGAATMKLAAADAGISGEPYTEAAFNLGANGSNRVEGITRDGIPYVRLAVNA